MKARYIISAVLLFALLAFISIWLCLLLIDKSSETKEPEAISMAVSVSEEASSKPAVSEPEIVPEPIEQQTSETSSEEPEPPEPVIEVDFELSATETYPGEYISVFAYGELEASDIVTTNPFSRDPVFFKQGDHLTALFPIKYTYEPGKYTLAFEAKGVRKEFDITLLSKEWQTQNLTVSGEVVNNTIESNSANDEYNQKVAPKKNLFETAALWNGAFMQPVAGRITTEFGMLRTVNGVPSDRHGGVDLAAAAGTPIVAANSGKILFAEYIDLTGNTICIEHGMGLKTWYYHMNALNVSEGDTVSKGQKIGEVGSTGFSTGPHLHWAASVFNVYVNPWTLVKAAPEI